MDTIWRRLQILSEMRTSEGRPLICTPLQKLVTYPSYVSDSLTIERAMVPTHDFLLEHDEFAPAPVHKIIFIIYYKKINFKDSQ